MKEDNQDDVFDSDGPQVEPTLLLEYLIQKAEELSTRNLSGFPLPFRALGVGALAPFPELYKEFVEIVSSSESPVKDRAGRCKEIFLEALARPQPQDSNSYASSGEETPFHPVMSNRFVWAARREGEEMVEKKDFRFMPVWICMTWIGLHGDAEKLRDFQEKCLQISDPAERIEQMSPILWEALRGKMRRK